MIKNKEFFPVIVFSFSRRECEEYAKQCKKIHFNDEEEAEAVEETPVEESAEVEASEPEVEPEEEKKED